MNCRKKASTAHTGANGTRKISKAINHKRATAAESLSCATSHPFSAVPVSRKCSSARILVRKIRCCKPVPKPAVQCLQQGKMADSVIGLSAIQGTLSTRVLTTADFDDLVQRNQKRIFRLLMGLLHDEDAADTLTQECFLRAYKKKDSFRGESS